MPKRRAASLAATVAAAAAAVAVASSGGGDGRGGGAAGGLPFERRARLGALRPRRRLQSAAPSSDGEPAAPTVGPTAAAAPNTPAPTLPKCACGPTAYEFRIDLGGRCGADTIDGNPGIEGSVCFYARGEVPSSADVIDFPGGRRGLLRAADNEMDAKWERLLEGVDHAAHREHAASVLRRRRAQDFDTVPTVITSATFLEADSTAQLNIINQNSAYFNTTLADGDTLAFPSISAQLNESLSLYDQLDSFPGGVVLVLYGINADDLVIQNMVAWGYDVEACGVVPLSPPEAIGWVTLVETAPPRAAFCDAVTGVPTAFPSQSPVVAPPTVSPTEGFDKSELTLKPTRSPTPPPTRSPTPPPTPVPFKAKSSKAKSCKSGHKGKSSKGTKGCEEESMSMNEDDSYTLFPKHSKKTPGDVNGYTLFPKSGKGEHHYTLFPKSGKKGHGNDLSMLGKAASVIDTGYTIFPKSAKGADGKSDKGDGGLFPKSDKEGGASSEDEDTSYGGKSSKRAKATKSAKGWASKSEGGKSAKLSFDYEADAESAKSAKALFGNADGAYALFKPKSAKGASSKSAKMMASTSAKSEKSSDAASGKAGKLFKPSGKATKVFKPKGGKGEDGAYDSADDGWSKPSPPGSVQVARPPIEGTVPRPTLPPATMDAPGTPRPTGGSSMLSASQLDEIGGESGAVPSALPSPTVAVTPTYPPTPAVTAAPTAGATNATEVAPPTLAPVTSLLTSSPTVSPTTSPPTSSPTESPATSPPTSSPTVSPTTTPPTSSPTVSPVVPVPPTLAPVVPAPPTTSAPAAIPRTPDDPSTESPRPSTHYPTYSPSTHYPTYAPTVPANQTGTEEPV